MQQLQFISFYQKLCSVHECIKNIDIQTLQIIRTTHSCSHFMRHGQNLSENKTYAHGS